MGAVWISGTTARARWCALCVVLAMAACSADEPATGGGWDLGCSDGLQTLLQELHERWVEPRSCDRDDECVLASSDTECPHEGAIIYSCPFIVHRESREAFEGALAEVQAEVCPRVNPDCHGGAGCVVGSPACVDGQCVGVEIPVGDASIGDSGR